MVGSNNVGKSTICDALDLVLGPDRLNRFPPIDEFDFYNAQYLASPAQEGAEPEEIPLRVEVILIELSAEIDAKCGGNTEFWHLEEQRLLGEGKYRPPTRHMWFLAFVWRPLASTILPRTNSKPELSFPTVPTHQKAH